MDNKPKATKPTIGSMVLTLNRDCEKLSQITEQESKGLSLAFRKIEGILARTFKPDKVNYLALMMIDNQVHFHVIPRYSKPITIGKHKYYDQNWPDPPELISLNLCEEEIMRIFDIIKKAI